jgi:hypothetical protein
MVIQLRGKFAMTVYPPSQPNLYRTFRYTQFHKLDTLTTLITLSIDPEACAVIAIVKVNKDLEQFNSGFNFEYCPYTHTTANIIPLLIWVQVKGHISATSTDLKMK